MKNLIFTLIIALLFGCQNATEAQTYGEVVPVEEFAEGIKSNDIQLVDVRTLKEYAQGHISNAENINVMDSSTFQEEIKSLDKTEPVYLYCKSGRRSQKAAQILEEKGFESIIDLDGGYQAWQKTQ